MKTHVLAVVAAFLLTGCPTIDKGTVPVAKLPQMIDPPDEAVFKELCGTPHPHPEPPVDEKKAFSFQSLDDLPVSGGDGSFWLKLGKYACPLQDGSYATHSHDSCHVFWILRPDPADPNRLLRRIIKMPPHSVVNVELEQKVTSSGTWVPGGSVRIEHGITAGYGSACVWQAPEDGHVQGALSDLSWRVSTTNVLLGPDASLGKVGPAFEFQPVSLRNFKWSGIESVRMKKVDVQPQGAPTQTFDLSNGCSQFQICGADRGIRCEALPAPCFPQSGQYTVVNQ